MNWFRFFLGTPQRFVATSIAALLILAAFRPGLVQMAVERLITELMPLFQLGLVIGVILVAVRVIFRGFLK